MIQEETSTPLTNPTGKSFLSYRRTRLNDAELLVQAQHDVGIPTWRDVDDLKNEQTEEELTKVLEDPKTANAVVWVTEDVAESAVIPKVEMPQVKKRVEAKDEFFVVPVAAGGIDYERATEIMSTHLGLDDFSGWNLEKCASVPLDENHATEIAAIVLAARLEAIDGTLDANEPFRVGLFTRKRPSENQGLHVALNWQRHFDGRVASEAKWNATLVPSLGTVADALHNRNASRVVLASGYASLPALVALGSTFLEPSGVHVVWEQVMRNSGTMQQWSLREQRKDCGLNVTIKPSATEATDIAVIANITTDAHPTVKRGQEDGAIPKFRAFVDVTVSDPTSSLLETAGQAVDAVWRTADAIAEAKRKYPDAGAFHLFLAAPAGYAVMLGQKLNAVGPVQTYEHVPSDDRIGRYIEAVRLTPGD